MIEKVTNNLFSYASQSRPLNAMAKKWGLKLGASQVVAGMDIPSAMQKVKELNARGIHCTLDHLGEFVSTEPEARESANYCVNTIEAIADHEVNSHLSVKLTQIGLDISYDFTLENMRRIVSTAAQYGIFVRIDMEDYSHCQMTLDLLQELRKDFDNVGTVIQAYLYRSAEDIDQLNGVSLRLVKGAYKESPEVAFQDKRKVDENFFSIIKQHLDSGSYTAVASHDHTIIEKVKAYTEERGITREQFEFQFLYGFRTELQETLAQEGYKVRVYVPFGDDWFGFYMRRLAERPQNIAFALKGLFSK
ncbi:proline dehydrogenase family protein [Bacillus marinisedimentorum]|uniref:proline dehydrogenase family protein n=1 Tax=Bacillus marinisedimentorum TaxID=1821260 RepID=UPI0008727A89|nr:proline dehydrogenase [Bacillus marinisedimentorum]